MTHVATCHRVSTLGENADIARRELRALASIEAFQAAGFRFTAAMQGLDNRLAGDAHVPAPPDHDGRAPTDLLTTWSGFERVRAIQD